MLRCIPAVWPVLLPAFCLFGMQAQIRVDTTSAGNQKLRPILEYIASSWATLTRSTSTCESVPDTKLTEEQVLYLPSGFAIPGSLANLERQCKIRIAHLPFVISGPGQITRNGVQPPGVLFLENPYVVPGGRFNEMYGWDSYFIILGLLRAGKLDLARDMAENFWFEIEHYGGILNANRTYYLTRSQPPFLSSIVMAVYDAEKARGQANREWLRKAYGYVERDYQMWTRDPHLAGTTGLSRYYDFGEGPVPEGLHDEIGYYHDVLEYFVRQPGRSPYLQESQTLEGLFHPEYSQALCGDQPASADCRVTRYVALSPEYYKGDRSMRESGFDISFRFGPYGADTDHYAPVCLNSLLYKTERDLENMALLLREKQAAQQWRRRADKRKKIIQKLLWNSRQGMFFDYNFRDRELSSYTYATTFYPLWAGIATAAQARAVVSNLHWFEQEGGLAMSTRDSGVQWDYPYGWAPIQLLAVQGLRRYGYDEAANRISTKFLSMVLQNFLRDGNLREKYNVVTDSSNLSLREGYRGNIIGFGWTNAVFLELLSNLDESWKSRIPQNPGR